MVIVANIETSIKRDDLYELIKKMDPNQMSEVHFIKKDGSKRKMIFTIMPPEKIVKELEKKKKEKKEEKPKKSLPKNIVNVWDHKINEFRRINLDTVSYIRVGVFEFRVK